MINKSRVRSFEFVLVISGISAITAELETALFNAGCDDATISMQRGKVYLDFNRTAPSLGEAILSAIQTVHDANVGAKIERVDMCDLVTISEIARRVGRSKQRVHQYIHGKGGPGNFPAPICTVSEKAPLWYWCEVAYWLHANNMISEDDFHEACDLAAINSTLQFAHQRQSNPELSEKILRLTGSSRRNA